MPHEPVRTEAARAAMPAEVPVADAVFNTAHGALLMLGLTRGDWDLVGRGLADRLHQPRRAHLYPRSMELVEEARSGSARSARRSAARARPCWSGRATSRPAAVVEALRRRCEGWADVLRAPFETMGADVRSL